MNVIDAYVKRVLDIRKRLNPYTKQDYWIVTVEYVDEGGKGETELLRYSEEDANNVKIGDIFQH